VQFRCTINSATSKNIGTVGTSVTIPVTGERGQNISEISPGVAIQRDCGSIIYGGPHPSNVRIDATFVWPVIDHVPSISRYFVSNTDSSSRSWMSQEK
jgi:hypothetical protein